LQLQAVSQVALLRGVKVDIVRNEGGFAEDSSSDKEEDQNQQNAEVEE
jgi:hypothetical protein